MKVEMQRSRSGAVHVWVNGVEGIGRTLADAIADAWVSTPYPKADADTFERRALAAYGAGS